MLLPFLSEYTKLILEGLATPDKKVNFYILFGRLGLEVGEDGLHLIFGFNSHLSKYCALLQAFSVCLTLHTEKLAGTN